MSFEIELNISTPEHGPLLSADTEVAVQCWFTASGRPIPQKMKVKTENGEIVTIEHIQTKKIEEHWYAGVKSIKFTCNTVVNETLIDFILIFQPDECVWKFCK